MDVDPQVEDLTGSEADDKETLGGEVVFSVRFVFWLGF